jgi:hypothetical protein
MLHPLKYRTETIPERLGGPRSARTLFRAISTPASASNRERYELFGKALGRLMTHTLEYKGYRLEVGPVCKGWRAAIYSRGSASPLLDSPTNLEKSRKEDIIVRAKQIIDAQLGPRLL